MLYRIIFNLHIVVSFLALLSGILLVARAMIGWTRKKEFVRADLRLSLIFTVSLYAQLILGSGIYYMLRASSDHPILMVPPSNDDPSLRFWAIEHIALMIFALLIAQLGRIYIRNSRNSLNRYKASLFYYGIPLVLILFSLGMAIISE